MRGLLLRRDNAMLRHVAERRGLAVQVSDEPALPWDLTLVASGSVPWSLVDAGFRALERWEVAAPIDGQLAEDVGGESDRERTRAVVRDLRAPLYSIDLVLIRRCEATERLIEAWRAERGGDERLAFLRALYRAKPLILALPKTWLQQVAVVSPRATRRPNGDNRLVYVQIAPGRSVCCRPEEAEMYRQRFAELAHQRRR